MRCILTNGGARFITAETLACLTGNKVYQDAFETPEEYLHIELARWADLIVVLPASASLIGRWATGQGNDLAGMLFLADVFTNTLTTNTSYEYSNVGTPCNSIKLRNIKSLGCLHYATR